MLMKMVNKLDPAPIGAPANGYEVEHRQVLHYLTQPDPPGVRADGYSELRRQQDDGQVLVHPGDPAGVDLANLDRPARQQLLEHHPVGDVLTGRYLDRCHRTRDSDVAKDVVWARRFLDPVQAE